MLDEALRPKQSAIHLNVNGRRAKGTQGEFRRMPDQALKYLDFLQSTITRMAGYSFLLKGWSIAITTALIGVAYKDGDKELLLIGLLPVLLLWGLDGYFLTLERRFRDLFKLAADAIDTPRPSFDMAPGVVTFADVLSNMGRVTQAAVHGPLALVLLVLGIRFLG
jgi:hypothetical protein